MGNSIGRLVSDAQPVDIICDEYKCNMNLPTMSETIDNEKDIELDLTTFEAGTFNYATTEQTIDLERISSSERSRRTPLLHQNATQSLKKNVDDQDRPLQKSNSLRSFNARRPPTQNGPSMDYYKAIQKKEHMSFTHLNHLIRRYTETVDGGFLTPYHWSHFMFEYNTRKVQTLIIQRKLAPFYTPLDNYEKNWSKSTVLKNASNLRLHEEYQKGKIESNVILNYLCLNSTKRFSNAPKVIIRRGRDLQHKNTIKLFYSNAIIIQEQEEENYHKAKEKWENSRFYPDKNLPSKDLIYTVYRDCIKCPICFLYVPQPLNYSTCCKAPICTECFIKLNSSRTKQDIDLESNAEFNVSDDDDNPKEGTIGLVSWTSNLRCPFCCKDGFSILYQSPTNRKTGICGVKPSLFSIRDNDKFSSILNASHFYENTFSISLSDIELDWK